MAYFMKLSGKYLSTKKKKKEKKKEIEWDEVYILLGPKRFFFFKLFTQHSLQSECIEIKTDLHFSYIKISGGPLSLRKQLILPCLLLSNFLSDPVSFLSKM